MVSKMSKVKDIVKSTVKKTDLTAAKTGSDPRDGWSSSGAGGGIAIPESIISNRADLLKKFYQSKGYNINYVSKNKRVAQSKMGDFDKWKRDHGINEDDQVDEHIVKTDGGYKLVSKKTGKNLGTASSLAGIKKREAQVQYFKHQHEEVNEDLTTKISHPETRSEVKHSPTLKRKRQLDQAASQYAIPAPAGTMKRTMAKEESQIDEVSLGDYKAKATQQSKELKKHTSGEYGDLAKRMLARREKGLKMASTREEVEQVDEVSSQTLDSYKEKAKKSVDTLSAAGKHRKANDRLMNVMKATGKQIQQTTANIKKSLRQEESTLEAGAACNQPWDGANSPDDVIPAKRSAAKMVKSLVKKHVKEDMYDHEKEDKPVVGSKKPTFQKPGVDTKTKQVPDAAAVLKGGTTMTGEKRDTIEIDPMMKVRKQTSDSQKSL